MELYTVLLLLICFYYFVFCKSNYFKRGEKIFVIFTCISIIIFQGLRSFTVGIDIKGYIETYPIIGKLNINLYNFNNIKILNYESGYIILNKLLYSLGLNDRDFLIVIAAIIQIPIFYTVHKYSKNKFLSVLVYLSLGHFFMTFSGLRQSIVMSICFFSYVFIEDKKPVKFIVTILLACLFHKSAVFCLILYPLFYMKIDKKKLCYVALLFVIVFIFKNKFYEFMSSLYYGESFSIDNTGAFTMLLIYVFLLYISYFWIYEFTDEKDKIIYNGLRNMLLILIFINIFARIGFPITLYLTIFIPILIERIRIKPKGFVYILIYIFLIYAFYSFMGEMQTLPFSFF